MAEPYEPTPKVEALAEEISALEGVTDGEIVTTEMTLLKLGGMAHLRAVIDEEEQRTVEVARMLGATWEDIGSSIGVTGSAVQQRFKRGIDERAASGRQFWKGLRLEAAEGETTAS